MASKKPSIRVKRVADLIKRELAHILRKEINDPRLKLVSLTLVNISPDLKNARVYYTIPDKEAVAEVDNVLNKASGFIRSELASRSELRYVPKMLFIHDKKLSHAEDLVSLITQVNKDTEIDPGSLDKPDEDND